ncbi:hypothetical protein PHMEG_0006628 [Phytophthora megakarya]|uniref:Uncharacterized protein n=1 Tax=Phytophthora megakarya TaxID=4795 RepID=A0A225WPW7_9STRA|nr:hypothetical protein PHMEG_0006628 [Phytophthora megakarya]
MEYWSVNSNSDDWDTTVSLPEFGYNSRYQASIGTSPFQADIGYMPSTPTTINRIMDTGDMADSAATKLGEEFVEKQKNLLARVKRQLLAAQDRRSVEGSKEAKVAMFDTSSSANVRKQSSISTDRDNDLNTGATDTANRTNTNMDSKQNETANKQSEINQEKCHVAQTRTDTDNQYCHCFSSYSFSNSSILDGKGQRLTSMRRCYEDSTDGKKLRSTWNRMDPIDDGHHTAVCSCCPPSDFEALWKHSPFGEMHKKTIKDQQQMQLEHAQQEQQVTV